MNSRSIGISLSRIIHSLLRTFVEERIPGDRFAPVFKPFSFSACLCPEKKSRAFCGHTPNQRFPLFISRFRYLSLAFLHIVPYFCIKDLRTNLHASASLKISPSTDPRNHGIKLRLIHPILNLELACERGRSLSVGEVLKIIRMIPYIRASG